MREVITRRDGHPRRRGNPARTAQFAGAFVGCRFPIGITVEGANILTRSMIIYAQGAIRCHPFVQFEIAAIAESNLKKFDRALFGHINLLMHNITRAKLLACGRAAGLLPRHARKIRRASIPTPFAIFRRVRAAVGRRDGNARPGSSSSAAKKSRPFPKPTRWRTCLLASASPKRFIHDEGKTSANWNLVRWSTEHCLYRVQEALLGVLENCRWPGLAAFVLSWAIFPLGARFRPPSDKPACTRWARDILEDREARINLTPDIFVPPPTEEGLGIAGSRARQSRARDSRRRNENCAMRCAPAHSTARRTYAGRLWAARLA